MDACFRFVSEASRKLGHVQYFSIDPFQHHHAWVKAEHGAILRAYAWAKTTLWNQGRATGVERDLGLACFDYGADADAREQRDAAARNVEKLPLLAARWSFDPGDASLRAWARTPGVAGEVSFRA